MIEDRGRQGSQNTGGGIAFLAAELALEQREQAGQEDPDAMQCKARQGEREVMQEDGS